MPWTDDGRKRAVEARVQLRREQQADHDEQLRAVAGAGRQAEPERQRPSGLAGRQPRAAATWR